MVIIGMGDITSLKARLAKLRLAGTTQKQHADVRRQTTALEEEETKPKKGSWSYGRDAKTRKAGKDPYNQYTKNTGGKRKKNNKLTRSDQKRGKKVPEARGRGTIHERNLPGPRGEKARREYAEFKKNTLDKIPDFDYEGYAKKNKLTRSDKKRP
jgi:hypothetical protein